MNTGVSLFLRLENVGPVSWTDFRSPRLQTEEGHYHYSELIVRIISRHAFHIAVYLLLVKTVQSAEIQ